METRRSTRLAHKQDAPNKPTTEEANNVRKAKSSKPARSSNQPATKRAKHTETSVEEPKPTTKKRKGKLAKLPEMPLDILYEIFSQLYPYDLLRLSRTTKALRGVLLNRSSRPVWTSAIASVRGLPPCPVDLSEPKYVRLAFDSRCSYCLAPNCHNIEWACRVRVCKSCYEGQDYFRPFPGRQEADQVDPAMPEAVATRLKNLIPTASGFRTSQYCFRVIHAKKLCEAYKAVEGNKKAVNALFVKTNAELIEVTKHADLCKKWETQSSQRHQMEGDAMRKKRRDAILANLRELGYDRECDQYSRRRRGDDSAALNAFHGCKLLGQPKELTPRIWNNIREEIVELMDDIRQERHKKIMVTFERIRYDILRELWAQYCQKQPKSTVVPPFADICDMPVFRAVAEAPFDADEHDTITAESFDAAFLQLPQLIDQWHQASRAKLLTALPAVPGRSKRGKPDLARLDLATSLFACTECSHYGPVFQPDNLLVHHHMSSRLNYAKDWRRYEYRVKGALWNEDGQYAKFHKRGATAAAAVVEACRLDAGKATAAEMDELDTRFTCACCVADNTRKAMSWKQAIKHICARDYEEEKPIKDFGLKRLNADEVTLAKQLEAKLTLDDYEDTEGFVCARCPSGYSYWRFQWKNHIVNSHDVKANQIGLDDLALPADRFTSLALPVRIPVAQV